MNSPSKTPVGPLLVAEIPLSRFPEGKVRLDRIIPDGSEGDNEELPDSYLEGHLDQGIRVGGPIHISNPFPDVAENLTPGDERTHFSEFHQRTSPVVSIRLFPGTGNTVIETKNSTYLLQLPEAQEPTLDVVIDTVRDEFLHVLRR